MREGLAFSELVEFNSGFPDGDITWTLFDDDGVQITTGTVTPAADSVSAVITIPAVNNTLVVGVLSSSRELHWTYLTGGAVIVGTRRYRLDAFLPLGVSEDGVRRKLGVEQHEVDDEAIDLVIAYSDFRETVGEANLTAATGRAKLLARDAIEALAGLAMLPSLTVNLAAKESSGTTQFQRSAVDWEAIRTQLERQVTAGVGAVNPSFDPAANFGSLLTVVVRDDPVTG